MAPDWRCVTESGASRLEKQSLRLHNVHSVPRRTGPFYTTRVRCQSSVGRPSRSHSIAIAEIIASQGTSTMVAPIDNSPDKATVQEIQDLARVWSLTNSLEFEALSAGALASGLMPMSFVLDATPCPEIGPATATLPNGADGPEEGLDDPLEYLTDGRGTDGGNHREQSTYLRFLPLSKRLGRVQPRVFGRLLRRPNRGRRRVAAKQGHSTRHAYNGDHPLAGVRGAAAHRQPAVCQRGIGPARSGPRRRGTGQSHKEQRRRQDGAPKVGTSAA